MAVDKKISQLTSGAPAQAGDEYVVARSGANYKLTLTNIAASMPPIGATTPNSGAFTTLSASGGLTLSGGNLAFTGTAQRITGDFSNATVASRLAFQTSTTNGNTIVGAIPNGTAVTSVFRAFNNSDPTNSGQITAGINSTNAFLAAGAVGSGTQLPLTFEVNGSERVRIDTSGNVGIGTSSPSGRLNVAVTTNTGTGADNCGLFVTSTNRAGFAFLDSAASSAASVVFANAGTEKGRIIYYNATDAMAFQTGGSSGTERMRIDASGNVGIGNTAANVNDQVGAVRPLLVSKSDSATTIAGSQANIVIGNANTTTSNTAQLTFAALTGANTTYFAAAAINCIFGARTNGQYPTGQLVFSTSTSLNSAPTEKMRITEGGEVYIAGTTDQGAYNLQCNGTGVWGAGAYVNGSDARLKDDITTLNDGLNVVSQLRPVTFKYKPDYSKDQNVQTGFIAQELQTALEGKDYLDGIVQAGPNHLNVAYQSLIPILTKAIQEQQAMIDELKTKVAALEAK